MNGLDYLQAALATHMPLDLVAIMFDTNDVKPGFGQTPLDLSLDILRLASEVQKSKGIATFDPPSEVVIMVPPPFKRIAKVDWLQAMFSSESVAKLRAPPGVLIPMAQAAGFDVLGAGAVSQIDGIDGVHMSAALRAAIGQAVAAKAIDVLAN